MLISRNIRLTPCLLSSLLLLVSCGGGSSSSDPNSQAAITSGNAEAFAENMVSIDTDNNNNTPKKPPQKKPVIFIVPGPGCEGGSFSDDESMYNFDPFEYTIKFVFVDFNPPGHCDITFDGVVTGSGNDAGSTSTYTDFSVTYGAFSILVNGTATAEINAETGVVTIQEDTKTEHQDGSTYQKKLTHTETEQDTEVPSTSTETSGQLISDELGSVTVSTLSPIISYEGDVVPSEGKLLFSGANGSKMTLTYDDANTFSLEIDEDGDNVYEGLKRCKWLTGCIEL